MKYYLDNAATTRVFDEVFDIIKSGGKNFYNPSASYALAFSVRKEFEAARQKITENLHTKNGKLIFTSSATESNNMVANGIHLRSGQEIIISEGEHPSVYNSFKNLEKRGIVVKTVGIGKDGRVNLDEFKSMINSNVALISIFHVSNETGAINDIKQLVAIAKQVQPKVIFHSDGVQAVGKIKVNIDDLGVDLYTFSAHKIYCVRGIAGLWIKDRVTIDPLLYGGGQEGGLRSSTENVAGAVALSYCIDRVVKEQSQNYEKVLKLKTELIDKLKSSDISQFMKINSDENCSPYIVSLSFLKIKGEVLMNALETDDVVISTGSACSSKKAGNRTLESMGLSAEEVVGGVRISFSPYENYDIDYIANAIIKNVNRFLKSAKVKD